MIGGARLDFILKSSIIHCVKSIQIWSYFWSVFSGIRTEYGDLLNLRIQSECRKIRTRNNSVFGHFLRGEWNNYCISECIAHGKYRNIPSLKFSTNSINDWLTLSWRRSLSYVNQSIDLQSRNDSLCWSRKPKTWKSDATYEDWAFFKIS